MILFFIALAVASVAFWRAAIKILTAATLVLLASGVVTVLHYMHHLR